MAQVDTQKISKTQEELDEKLKVFIQILILGKQQWLPDMRTDQNQNFLLIIYLIDFIPLSGDRFYGEDKSVLTGFAKFNGQSVLVIGQEKGEI